MGSIGESSPSTLAYVHSLFNMTQTIEFYLDQWDILHDYFLRFLPEKQPTQIRENKRYDSIKSILSSHLSKARLNFVLYLCENIFERFLTHFQSEEPLIHILRHEMTELYRNVLLSFLKPDSIQQKSSDDLLDVGFEQGVLWRSDKDIRIGKLYWNRCR